LVAFVLILEKKACRVLEGWAFAESAKIVTSHWHRVAIKSRLGISLSSPSKGRGLQIILLTLQGEDSWSPKYNHTRPPLLRQNSVVSQERIWMVREKWFASEDEKGEAA